MFVRATAQLPRPAEQVEAALLQAPQAWLPGLALGAHDQARRLLAEVGVRLGGGGHRGGGHRLGRRVEVQLAQPLRVAAGLLLPVRWHAASVSGLFPEFDGELQVAAVAPGRCQVGLSGQYAPPLGAVGQAMDRLVLHRVAEATCRDFLDRVAAQLLAVADERGVADHVAG